MSRQATSQCDDRVSNAGPRDNDEADAAGRDGPRQHGYAGPGRHDEKEKGWKVEATPGLPPTPSCIYVQVSQNRQTHTRNRRTQAVHKRIFSSLLLLQCDQPAS